MPADRLGASSLLSHHVLAVQRVHKNFVSGIVVDGYTVIKRERTVLISEFYELITSTHEFIDSMEKILEVLENQQWDEIKGVAYNDANSTNLVIPFLENEEIGNKYSINKCFLSPRGEMFTKVISDDLVVFQYRSIGYCYKIKEYDGTNKCDEICPETVTFVNYKDWFQEGNPSLSIYRHNKPSISKK